MKVLWPVILIMALKTMVTCPLFTFPGFLAHPPPVNKLQPYWIQSIFSSASLLPIFQLSGTYFFSRRALSNISESVKVDPPLCSVDFVLSPSLAPFCNCLFLYPYVHFKLLRDSDFLTKHYIPCAKPSFWPIQSLPSVLSVNQSSQDQKVGSFLKLSIAF